MMKTPINLNGLTLSLLRELLTAWNFSPTHATVIWRQLYHSLIQSPSELRDLPTPLQARFIAETSVEQLKTARESDSSDGFTRKFLLALPDERQIETVLMRFPRRAAACLSSQVGCAMGCVFCATGQMGFTRQLTAGEIVAQAVHVSRVLRSDANRLPERLRNIVLMGMGEPLHNYEAVMRAVEILRDPGGLAIGAKQFTLSTVGIVPGIIRLADEGHRISLAISLHAATQDERDRLVPIARAWPLDELISACRYYCQKLEQRIFFEWTLIAGTNDSPHHARALAALLAGLPARVNLIPLNPTAGFAGAPALLAAARSFQSILREQGVPSTLRQRRGIDIAAGCGQLAGV